MFTNCTSPMISLKTYINLIRLSKKITKKDSFNTTTEMKEFLSIKKALNFKTKTPNSQDLPSSKTQFCN